jgi:SAM-dependent methyltransferase
MKWIARVFKKILDWRHQKFIAGSNRFRENRLRFFAEKLLADGDLVLDIGYGYGQFENQMLQMGLSNTIIGLDITLRDTSNYPNVGAFIVADASYLPLAGQSIGAVYCNSLLEHLEGWDAQQRAFVEIQRVARKYFVQTPYRHFPLEAHHWVPFFQYLPVTMQKWIGRNLLGHFERVWLLDKHDVNKLAELDNQISIYQEKVFGLLKSFALYKE